MMMLFFVLFSKSFPVANCNDESIKTFLAPISFISTVTNAKKNLLLSPFATEGTWLIANHSFFWIQDERVETQMLFVNFFNY